MHLETFLYMLLQSDKTLPPPGLKPDFEALARQASMYATPNDWIKVPAQNLEVGKSSTAKSLPNESFGWDNEMPVRKIKVPAFEAQARPLTNGDYARYLSEGGIDKYPASWIIQTSNGHDILNEGKKVSTTSSDPLDSFILGKAVRTVYGPVPLAFALDWPVMASYNELAGCARWMNGRIPTSEEVHSIYAYVERLRGEQISFLSPGNIPAVNGHLVNDGVEESPPQGGGRKRSGTENGVTTDPNSLFTDLGGCNVGFKAFHPVPVTQNGNTLAGRGGMGGVWEWTSSVLERWEGFEPMEVYPAYTGLSRIL